MQGPGPEAVNTTGPKCRPVEAIDPTLASRACQQFQVDPAVMFVQDVVEEHARVMREAKRRMRVVEELEDDASTDFDPAKFSAEGPQACGKCGTCGHSGHTGHAETLYYPQTLVGDTRSSTESTMLHDG